MYERIVFVAIVCFGVLVVGRSCGHGGPYKKIKACCTTLPSVTNWESMKECRPPRPQRLQADVEEENGDVVEDTDESLNEDKEDVEDSGEGRLKGGIERWKHHKNKSCAMECAFKKEGFITTGPDGKNIVNLVALNSKLTSLATGNWESAIKAAMGNCTETAPEVNLKRSCPSGASEISKCLLRNMAAQCPDAVQTPECKEQLARMSQHDGRRQRRRNRKDRNNNRDRDIADSTPENDDS